MEQHLDVGYECGLVLAEVAVQGSELHILGDDEDGPPLTADAVQLDQVLMLQLTAGTDTGEMGPKRDGKPATLDWVGCCSLSPGQTWRNGSERAENRLF